jgi:hypothetical protein
VELRQQVSDEIGAAYDVEPPPGLARRPDFQPPDADVEPGGMIVAGVHYGRAEVDAARRLLRELGQSERALDRLTRRWAQLRRGIDPSCGSRPASRRSISASGAATGERWPISHGHLMRTAIASSIMPRTTLDLDASVLRELRRRRDREGKSMGRVASELLAAALADPNRAAHGAPFTWRSGDLGIARVDLEDKEALGRLLSDVT